MTDIGELVVRIKADAAQLQAEMNKATGTVKQSAGQMSSALQSVKGTLEALGIAFGAVAIAEFGKKSIEAAFNIQNLADRIDFSASSLYALRPILASTGSSVDEFSHSVYMMNNFIQQAIDGNPKAIETLNKLGLSATALKNLQPEDAMNAMVDAIYRLGNITDQTAAGREVFSRQWATLIPLMLKSKGHLEDFINEEKKLAPNDADIKLVHDFWASIEDGALHAEAAVIKFGAAFARASLLTVPGGGGSNSHVSNTLPSGVMNLGPHDPNAVAWAQKQYEDELSGKGNNNNLNGPPKVQVNQLQTYIKGLQDESAALDLSKLRLMEVKAEREGAAKAIEDYNNGLRKSKDLTTDEIESIDASVDAYNARKEALDKIHKQEEEELHMQAQLKAEISSALAQGIMDYKNFGSAVKSVLSQIVKQIIEMQVTTPLVKGIGNLFGGFSGGGLSSGGMSAEADFTGIPAFASGGSPPVGMPSLVGENGPELFVPNTAGTIVPNSKMGGISVQNTFIMQPGLSETVNAAVMRSAPTIIQASHDSVIAALQKGGSDSRVARLRA